MDKTAGIVLAGGRSSRMGSSKALLRYKGVPLIEHMQGLLRQAGLKDVYISGDVPGYDCINDAVIHDGPARAMHDLLRHFEQQYERILFVPVDMPLLDIAALQHLLAQPGSVYYDGYPIPACLATGDDRADKGSFISVRDFLAQKMARMVPLNADPECMANINTQEEWKDIAS